MHQRDHAWHNPRVLLLLGVIFLSGAAVGALLVYTLRPAPKPVYAATAAERQQLNRDTLVERFEAELDLSAEQAMQLEAILDDFFKYYHSLQNQMDDVRASGKRRIRELLNKEQQAKFERMMKELGEASKH